jgi:signal peptidase I
MKRSTGFVIGLAALGAVGVSSSIRRYVIAEQSMSPALNDGDWVIAQRSTRRLRRGEIIVFEHPVRTAFSLVKRVIGLPGETVSIIDGTVHVDGIPLSEPWADGPTRPDGRWSLSPDEVFVLSDARSVTIADSRAFGPIHVATTAWRVRFRYWPAASVGPVATGVLPDARRTA